MMGYDIPHEWETVYIYVALFLKIEIPDGGWSRVGSCVGLFIQIPDKVILPQFFIISHF